jgi:hypothetical protein
MRFRLCLRGYADVENRRAYATEPPATLTRQCIDGVRERRGDKGPGGSTALAWALRRMVPPPWADGGWGAGNGMSGRRAGGAGGANAREAGRGMSGARGRADGRRAAGERTRAWGRGRKSASLYSQDLLSLRVRV